jgi:hypothetical protein
MNSIFKWLIALALLSGPVVTNAALIEGTYSGTVVAGGFGMIGTLDSRHRGDWHADLRDL